MHTFVVNQAKNETCVDENIYPHAQKKLRCYVFELILRGQNLDVKGVLRICE